MAQNNLPTLTNFGQLEQVLKSWQQGLKRTLKRVATPTIPWNFAVATKQGGNLLSWTAVKGADGYEVQVSVDGSFTDTRIVQLRSQVQTNYFDPVPISGGGTPAKRYYRIRATAGTIQNPASVKGADTQTIAATAIAPNDTATASVSVVDTATNDTTQSYTRGAPLVY